MAAEVRNYCRDLPMTAPDYLRAWAEAREWPKNCLIYSAGWYRDPLTGLKSRCADVLCTACGKRFKADWISGYACHGMGEGPKLQIGSTVLRNYADGICPECGANIQARHKTGSGGCGWETTWPMTLMHIPEPGKADRLCLLLWRATKEFDWEGRRSISIRPEQAYIVEERRMFRCNRAMAGMGGRIWYDDWHQLQRCTDELREIVETVCPGGIAAAVEGTTCENAKVELYLQDWTPCFPAAWLWLWLKHRNAETLMTCGAAELVRVLIGQEKIDTVRDYRSKFSGLWPVLQMIDWKAKRPSTMLGLNREELRRAAALQAERLLGGGTWMLTLQLHRLGLAEIEDAPRIEAMLGTGGKYARERLMIAAERAGSFRRLASYLEAQGRRSRKAKGPSVEFLLDYWHMAEEARLDMTAPEVLLPRDLTREHDRLVEARNRAERERQEARRRENEEILRKMQEKRASSFTKRFEKLSALAWERDGLLIFPPKDEAAMIQEGLKLHHCVATYAQRHADGQTTILFIRRADAPEEPYFTLNWDEKDRRIIQNRGLRNCDPPAKVRAFAEAWADWVRAGCPKEKREQREETAS